MSYLKRALPLLLTAIVSAALAACSSAPADPVTSAETTEQVVAAAETTQPDQEYPYQRTPREHWGAYQRSETKLNLAGATYTGSKDCVSCHERIHRDWVDSLHTGMFQEIEPRRVKGDFTNKTLEHWGWQFRMSKENEKYYIHERKPRGEETLYQINYLLGSKRIQHYLSLRPDGSMRVTFPTWDILEGKWIHGSTIVRSAHNPRGEMVSLAIQIWNKHCWNCHTSQLEEGYDVKTHTFKTTYTEPGINCEMCHGPGSVHVERMNKDSKAEITATVNAVKFGRHERMYDCMQCHSRRIQIKKGYHLGENFHDYYQLKFRALTFHPPSDPPIWIDRARRFANECLLLWESQCYLKGDMTCVTCHDAHQATISKDPRYQNMDVLCTQCHTEYKEKEAVTKHTFHPFESKGSRCIECHMLHIYKDNIKLLQGADIRDHYISIPIPETTIKHSVPNHCNNACHVEKSNEWVIEWMDKWYPDRPKVDEVEDAFNLAWQRSPEAVPRLIKLMNDTSRGLSVRAGATSFLGEFRGDEVAAALINGLDDPSVEIQAEAARALSEVAHASSVEPLMKKLNHETLVVRLNAVFALIKMNQLQVTGTYARAYKKAEEEYVEFLQEFPTVYETHVDLGTYHAVHQKFESALQEYKIARTLRPEDPLSHYYLGVTYAQMGMYSEALANLQETLSINSNFRNTRQLIDRIRQIRRRY